MIELRKPPEEFPFDVLNHPSKIGSTILAASLIYLTLKWIFDRKFID